MTKIKSQNHFQARAKNEVIRKNKIKMVVKKKKIPKRGIEPRPSRWEREILTTRPLGSWWEGMYTKYKYSKTQPRTIPSEIRT